MFQQQVAECPMGAACCAPYSGTFSLRGIASGCLPKGTSSTNVSLVDRSRIWRISVISTCMYSRRSQTLISQSRPPCSIISSMSLISVQHSSQRFRRPGSLSQGLIGRTEWLWNRVDIALELHQQKINRQEFDRTLKGKPQVLSSNTQLPKGNDSNAAPAPLHPPTIPAAPAPKEKKKKKKKKEKDNPEVPAAPAKGKGKGKGKGDASPRTPPGRRTPRGGRGGGGNTTPSSEQARRAGQMTKEETARTPCMFYAFGSCKAAKCDFLHDDSNKYTGPPPRSLATAKADAKAKPKPKPKPKAPASIAPLISAMPAATAQDKLTWIWDTGAGRHLIGKQALNHKATACVRRTDSPVGFATVGWGS